MKQLKFYSTLFILMVTHTAFSQTPKIENNQIIPDKPVTFKTGTDTLTADGEAALKQVKDFIADKTYISSLRVEGHSDNTGDEAKNQMLTEKRAMSACQWLIANGIDCKKLIAVGFGSMKPVDDNSTPMGRAANRRMVFAIAALQGVAIGGMPLDGGGKIAGNPCGK